MRAGSRQAQELAAAALGLLLSAGGCGHGPATRPPGTLHRDLTFTAYSPLSQSEEIVRRILSPLAFRRGQEALAARGQALGGQPLDLARERFTVYVPAGAPPPGGYGLLVFVAPWPEATEPRRWRSPLDRHGLILASAAGAGNESKVYERRLPLALLAWENVRARWPVDPRRVYVGGMSGGARVAEVAALAYPDVFRGALLNAGSEPIGGERGIRLPPAELFRRFQETRLVFATGALDEGTLQSDLASQASMTALCVLDVEVLVPPRLGHEPLDAAWLDRALAALERPSRPGAARRAACDAELEGKLGAELAAAEAALARGDRAGARARLDAIDACYGGLAAPATLALDARLGPPP